MTPKRRESDSQCTCSVDHQLVRFTLRLKAVPLRMLNVTNLSPAAGVPSLSPVSLEQIWLSRRMHGACSLLRVVCDFPASPSVLPLLSQTSVWSPPDFCNHLKWVLPLKSQIISFVIHVYVDRTLHDLMFVKRAMQMGCKQRYK